MLPTRIRAAAHTTHTTRWGQLVVQDSRAADVADRAVAEAGAGRHEPAVAQAQHCGGHVSPASSRHRSGSTSAFMVNPISVGSRSIRATGSVSTSIVYV